MSSALLLLAIASADVSYSADAVTVKELLRSLGAQASMELRCDTSSGEEPLIVQFENQPLDEVLNRIAAVTHTEWTNKGGVETLERTPQARKLEAEEEREHLEQVFTRLQKDIRTRIEKMPRFDTTQAQELADTKAIEALPQGSFQSAYARLGEINPLSRAAVHLFTRLPLKTLTGIPVGTRVAFSDKPHPVQLPLPNAGPAIQELVAGVKLLEAAKAKFGRLVAFGSVPQMGAGSLSAGYGKTIIAFTRLGTASYAYDVTVGDVNGQFVSYLRGTLPDRTVQLSNNFLHQGKPLDLPKVAAEFCGLGGLVGYAVGMNMPVQLEGGKTVYVNQSISMAESKAYLPSQELMNVLRNPVANDPTGLVFGSTLRRIASERKQPLIASIGDGAVQGAARFIASEALTTDADMLSFLEQTGVPEYARVPFVTIGVAGDWMSVEPYLPLSTRKERMKRGAMQALLGDMVRTGGLSLAAAGAYVRAQGSVPGFTSLPAMYIANIDPAIDQGIVAQTFTPVLPLLASLSNSQWTVAKNEGLSWLHLTDEQRRMVDEWIMSGRDFGMMLERKSFPGSPSTPLSGRERTEVLTRGIPADVLIKVEDDREDVLLIHAANGFRYFFNVPTVAYMNLHGSKINAMGTEADRKFVAFKPAVQAGYRVNVLLSPDLTYPMTLRETVVPTGALVKQEQLPTEIRAQIEAMQQEIKKAFSRGR